MSTPRWKRNSPSANALRTGLPRSEVHGDSSSFTVRFCLSGWLPIHFLWLVTAAARSLILPYILLNLMLSMTAAMQAPVILMSQNRATERDRFAAEQDFKVNLKSELMLDSLTRNDRERSVQIEQLMGAVTSLQRQSGVAADDQLVVRL